MSGQSSEITLLKENDNGVFEPCSNLIGLNKSNYWRFVDNNAGNIVYFRANSETFYRYVGHLVWAVTTSYLETHTTIGTYLDGVYNQVNLIVFMYLKNVYVNISNNALTSPIEEQSHISARNTEIKFYKNLRWETKSMISWGPRNEFSTIPSGQIHSDHINGFEQPGDYLIANNGKDLYCLYDYRKDQPTRYYQYFLRTKT